MNEKSTEPTRLTLGHVVLGGTMFRRSIIERARDKHRAVSPELGLDFELILQVALWMERRAMRYELVFTAGLGLALILLAAQPTAAFLFALCLAGIVAYKRYEEAFIFANTLHRDCFSTDLLRERFQIDIPHDLRRGVPQLDQNVMVYSGFRPFNDAGHLVGGWSFVVDTSRAKEPSHGRARLEPVENRDLLNAIEQSFVSLRATRVVCRDYLVVRGDDAIDIPSLIPNLYERPRQTLNEQALPANIQQLDERARSYKWISIFDWGDELVVSSLIYSSLIGENLFMEVKHYLLPPLASRFRQIDSLPRPSFRTIAQDLLTYFTFSPVLAGLAALALFSRLFMAVDRAFETSERITRRQIKDGPRYNYGAAIGLRRQMAGDVFTHYFQQTDQEMFSKLVNKRVLDIIVDFLDERGIDTSELRERQAMILNNGIIVHGGDVKADSLAVGKGARALQRIVSSKFSEARVVGAGK
jgi:hypothetical protein